jgi:exodeoxyribonuclease VII large subunit
MFLTLRDPIADVSVQVTCTRAVLDAVVPALAEGARVVVFGRPTYYVPRGSISFSAEEIRGVGIGDLLARLEQLRRLLAAEGLFDPGRKRRLPFLPDRVGLICGRAGAAERDVIDNARRRWPRVAFEVLPVPVQGPFAVAEIIEALGKLDADPAVEVIVIARGGGSVEDLLPFSDETLVRAVAACRTPVVSAIGHEQDAPLLDAVADVRASTPTDAAKLIVPDLGEQLVLVEALCIRTRRAVLGRLERETARLAGLTAHPVLADPTARLVAAELAVTAQLDRARRCVRHRIDRATDELTLRQEQVRALSPAATLNRGYAIVTRADGTVVRDPAQVADDETLRLRVAAGVLTARAHR